MGGLDLAGLGGLISAITGLLIGAGSFVLQRQRRNAIDTDEMEEDLEVRTQQYQAALRHIRATEDDYAERGLRPIPRPAELRPGYFQQQQAGGRRGRHRGAAPAAAGNGGSDGAIGDSGAAADAGGPRYADDPKPE